MDIKALLARKVAGVPVLWVLVIVGAVAVFGAFRMKGAEPEEEPTDAAATDEGDGEDTGQPVFSAHPVIMQPSGPESVSSTPMEDSNDLWARRAVEWLIAPGQGFNVSLASTAITKYINGETLSIPEGTARDKAIRQFGLPPEGLIPTATASASSSGYKGPATRQGNPPTVHKVKNANDNNPAELTRLYYGRTDVETQLFLRAANTSLVWPAATGASVTIPKFTRPRYYRSTSAVNNLYEIARKNGQTPAEILALNPGMKFPVKPKTRVRVN